MSVPKSLGAWKVGKLLGEGAFSGVYAARLTEGGVDSDKDQEWVLKLAKVPPPPKNPKRKSKKQKEAEASSKLLFWEYQVYRNFLRDLECVPMRPKGKYLYGEENSWRYLALQKLGTTLRARVESSNNGVLPTEECFDIASQILTGLEQIHQVGILFRDIKPENFMFGNCNLPNSRIYFVDFGASCKFILHSGRHLDTGNAPAGTPLYMSIFTHQLEPPSRRDDLVSLGYMLCWMLAGPLPWADAQSDEAVLSAKKSLTNKDICARLPANARSPVLDYLEACYSLGVHDKPDYRKLRNLFQAKGQRHAGDQNPRTQAQPSKKAKVPKKAYSKKKSVKRAKTPANQSKKRKQVVPADSKQACENVAVDEAKGVQVRDLAQVRLINLMQDKLQDESVRRSKRVRRKPQFFNSTQVSFNK